MATKQTLLQNDSETEALQLAGGGHSPSPNHSSGSNSSGDIPTTPVQKTFSDSIYFEHRSHNEQSKINKLKCILVFFFYSFLRNFASLLNNKTKTKK